MFFRKSRAAASNGAGTGAGMKSFLSEISSVISSFLLRLPSPSITPPRTLPHAGEGETIFANPAAIGDHFTSWGICCQLRRYHPVIAIRQQNQDLTGEGNGGWMPEKITPA